MRYLGLILFLMLTGPVAAQDSGLDSLMRRDETFGWEAAGRLDFGGAGFCTGTLVDTDLVPTAAPEDIGRIRFRAGLRHGEAVAEAAAARAVAHRGQDPHERTGEHSIRHDLALVRLAEPMPTAVAAPFAVLRPGAGGGAVLAAQLPGAGPEERRSGLQLRRGFRVIGRPGL